MSKPILYDYFSDKTEVLSALYKLSSKLKASNNIGKNRENFINHFLAVVLPKKLSIRSGEIWDKNRSKTGQIETLIVRDDGPALDFGGEDAYLAEGVFAVIEIKSNLTSAKLQEAAKTLQRVEKLKIDRHKFRMGYHLDRPLRIIFAYEGASWKTLAKSIKQNGWDDLFDLICILKRGVFIRKGRLLQLRHKKTNKPLEEDYTINSKVAALGILYLYLVEYGTSFSAGGIELEDYFNPLAKWGNLQEFK